VCEELNSQFLSEEMEHIESLLSSDFIGKKCDLGDITYAIVNYGYGCDGFEYVKEAIEHSWYAFKLESKIIENKCFELTVTWEFIEEIDTEELLDDDNLFINAKIKVTGIETEINE